MWLNRPNPGLVMIVSLFIAGIAMAASTFWTQVPTVEPIKCRDTIDIVHGKLATASCQFGQSLSYLRDFGGERYIMCKCRNESGEEAPKLPDIMLMPPNKSENTSKDDEDSQPTISSEPKDSYTL